MTTSELGFKASGPYEARGGGYKVLSLEGLQLLSAHTHNLEKIMMTDCSPCHDKFCIPLYFTSAWWFWHVSLCALNVYTLVCSVMFTGSVFATIQKRWNRSFLISKEK